MTLYDDEYELDRTKLIEWVDSQGLLPKMILKNAKENLILGSEHIITAQDILEEVRLLPYHLFDNVDPKNNVHFSAIKLIYIQSK